MSELKIISILRKGKKNFRVKISDGTSVLLPAVPEPRPGSLLTEYLTEEEIKHAETKPVTARKRETAVSTPRQVVEEPVLIESNFDI